MTYFNFSRHIFWLNTWFWVSVHLTFCTHTELILPAQCWDKSTKWALFLLHLWISMADTHLSTDERRIEATVCNFYGSAVSHACPLLRQIHLWLYGWNVLAENIKQLQSLINQLGSSLSSWAFFTWVSCKSWSPDLFHTLVTYCSVGDIWVN